MAWIIIMIVAGFGVGSTWAGCVLASRLEARRLLQSAIIGAGLMGFAGVICTFCVHWQPQADRRCVGFPFPIVLWQLEKGEWVDYIGGLPSIAANAVIFGAAGAFVVFCWIMAQWLVGRRRG